MHCDTEIHFLSNAFNTVQMAKKLHKL